MKILFLLRYFINQASSRVRGFYLAEELKRKGINCDVLHGYDKKIYISFLSKLFNSNIIFFQKRYSKSDIRLNRIAQALGKKTIFDIDDAPSGVNLDLKAEEQAIEMIKNSSAVIVGSHRLMDFAKNFNAHVYLIYSPVNLNYYKPEKKTKSQDYITLGWIGNGINYKKDLLTLIKPIEKIGERLNIKLTIVGALQQKEIHQNFGKIKNVSVEIIDSINWEDSTLISSVISDFDIGLYPLINNEYNQYKCGYKALEYMAMAIPVIASPVGETNFIVENGKDGFLASSEKEWEEGLYNLIKDENVRKRMGNMGREKIEKYHSLEVCANKTIEVFEEIKKH